MYVTGFNVKPNINCEITVFNRSDDNILKTNMPGSECEIMYRIFENLEFLKGPKKTDIYKSSKNRWFFQKLKF